MALERLADRPSAPVAHPPTSIRLTQHFSRSLVRLRSLVVACCDSHRIWRRVPTQRPTPGNPFAGAGRRRRSASITFTQGCASRNPIITPITLKSRGGPGGGLTAVYSLFTARPAGEQSTFLPFLLLLDCVAFIFLSYRLPKQKLVCF